MKSKKILPIILSALLLTACGSNAKSDSAAYITNSADGYYTEGAKGGAVQDYDYEASESESYDYSEEEADSSSAQVDESSSSAAAADNSDDVIKKEMLVYSCTMNVDVLEFENAVETLKTNLDMYGGFIENENYSDGGSSSRWYDENAQKWQTYTSTIRVPSSNYDAFCDAVSALGELRSKNANVQNVTREYYDLATTLEVYEAKEDRYIALLSTISEDEYALAVEDKLTSIQIEISKLKSRMNDIKTDVAYSYVYLTINEVKEYTPEPVKTDTFLDRLFNTLSDSAEGFLDFMEELLFVLIYLAPYIVIIGGIVMIIIKARKKSKAKKAAMAAAASAPSPAPAPENTAAQPVENSEKEKPEN